MTWLSDGLHSPWVMVGLDLIGFTLVDSMILAPVLSSALSGKLTKVV